MSRRGMRLIYSTRLVYGCSNVGSGKGRRLVRILCCLYMGCVSNYPLASADPHRLPPLVFLYTCKRLAATVLLIYVLSWSSLNLQGEFSNF